MRRLFWRIAALIVAAVVVWALVSLPPARTHIDVTRPDGLVFGAYHIHTDRSDGSGSIEDVARAAADAGLQFVVLTDHGTAATPFESPVYRHGVLVIDGVEISTRDGHVVALGLRDTSPYPLGGEARDVIEDVARMGGWTVAAHPDSPKVDLRWRGPATDAIEWINADSEWRDENRPLRVLQVGLHYLIRSPEAIASLFGEPQASVRRWDVWARSRHVTGLAAVDAHARIGFDEQNEPRATRTIFARPSYADMFRSLVQGVWLDAPLSGDGAIDAGRILDALRSGRTYSAVTAIASPAVLQVSTSASQLEAHVPGAPQAMVSIRNQGREVGSGSGRAVASLTTPGLYRVEVRWPGRQVPWMMSAPVFVPPSPAAPAITPDAMAMGQAIALAPAGPWVVEHHPATTASQTASAASNTFTFSFNNQDAGQFAALVHPLDPSQAFEEIHLTVRADRPRRFSVQVRLPGPGEGERWVRSVYADETPREIRVRLEDFEPADRPTSRRPVAARLQSLLFVVDEPHTVRGSSGRLEISAVSLRGPATSER